MGNPRFGRIEVFSHSINIIMSTSSWMAIAQICKTYLASFLHIFKKWNTRSYGSELSAWPEKYNFDHSVNKNAGEVNTDKKIFIFYLRPHFVGRIIVPGRSCFLRRSFLNSKHSRRCWRHFKFISISISHNNLFFIEFLNIRTWGGLFWYWLKKFWKKKFTNIILIFYTNDNHVNDNCQ